MPGDALGLLGQVVDQLRFDELVDEGGFGYIYRGRHLGLDEPVAIKCLKPRTGDPELVESFSRRFRDETKIAYRLSQGNLDIVRSISSGTLTMSEGALVPYMVLEWLEGTTLTSELCDRRDSGYRMSLNEAVELLDSAASAIGFAHSQGVVHRDIKPGNLFLANTRTGVRLKVLDFGLAKIVDPDGFMTPSGAATGSNVFIASPSYGAPEQFSKKCGAIGPWTDVYSLALVLLEMIAGKKVRQADNLVDGMMRALSPDSACPTPRKLGLSASDEVERVFRRATTIQAEARYRNATEFWSELRAALVTMPVERDMMKTISNSRGPASVRARSPAPANVEVNVDVYEEASAATTKHVWNRTMGVGAQAPLSPDTPPPQSAPASGLNATQRLGNDVLSNLRAATNATPVPGSVSLAEGGRTAQMAPDLARTALLQQPSPLPSYGAAPVSSRSGNSYPQAPLSPRVTGPQPQAVKRPAPTRGAPLWAALILAAILGAAGAFVIVYATRLAPKK